MEVSIEQQIFEQVRRSSKILVVLPENLSVDSIAAGLALRLFLSRLEKDVFLVSSGSVPANLKFLPGWGQMQNHLGQGNSLVISVDIAVKKVEEISYHTEKDKLNIYLKSKTDVFEPSDLSFSKEKFPVDLIIILGAASLEDLGQLQQQNADLFFETPKVNIDNQSRNEYFGQLNLVDVTATAVSEILAEFLQKYEDQLVDEDIATCLLAGIIAQTNSFQHALTTPQAFLKASELVSLGGRQQEIVKHIFKTKSLPLLKLWGRALARMTILDRQDVVYSLINFNDFEKAEAEQDQLLPVLKEFVDNISGYKIIVLLAEPTKGTVKLVAAIHEQLSLEKFLQSWEAKNLDAKLGHYKVIEASFPDTSIDSLQSKFLETLKK